MRTVLSAITIITLLISSQIVYASSQKSLNTNFLFKHPNAQIVSNHNNMKPSLVIDIDSQIKADVPLKDAAESFIMENSRFFGFNSANGSLMHEQTLSFKHNKLFKFNHFYKGVPVLNGETNVLFKNDNSIQRVYNNSLAISDLDVRPTVTYQEAIAEAWARVYGVSTLDLTSKELNRNYTALYIIDVGNKAHLAYAVGMPFPVITEKRIAFIDAHSGQLLKSYSLVKNAKKVNVYEYNPGTNQDQTTVEREFIDATENQNFCESALVETFNCPDEGGEMTINYGIDITVPMCTEKHIAEFDENGDMLYNPVLLEWSDKTSHADPFSEAHLFYHVQKIYERFQNIALHVNASEPPFETLNQVPLHSIANFAMPDINALFSGSPVTLVPFDNAFFVPANGLIPGEYPEEDSIVFGQGTTRDFAYDADVIYHEFTHAVIGTVVNLESISYDQYGLTTDPGALNEGYADYFSASYTGNPQMAEFVGGAFESSGEDSLRNLLNTKKCPDDVEGEVHSDSEWWAAALWTLREKYKASDEDHDDIDAAIFEALTQLPQTASFTVAATTTANVIGEWFGDEAKTFATQTFTERGLYNCDRAIPISSGFTQTMTQIYGKSAIRMNPYVPAMLQYHVTLEQPIDSITASFMTYTGSGLLGSSSADIEILVNKSSAVTFTFTNTGLVADYDFSVPFTKTSGASNYDIYEAVISSDTSNSLEAGDWYFIMVNKGNGDSMTGSTTLYFIEFNYSCSTDEDCGECSVCNEDGVCDPVKKECETDADCSGSLTVCVVDGCTATCELKEGACATGMDCNACETCLDNQCIPIDSECSTDEDCGEGKKCVKDASLCSGSCEIDEDYVAPDGDDNGSGASSGGGCNQSNTGNLFLLILMLGLAAFRKRARI